jgi:glucose/arabinose dehydrogenase
MDNSMKRHLSFLLVMLPFLGAWADDYYEREPIPLPEGEVMELGSIALMPNQEIAVSNRRGEIWICSGAYGADLSKVSWRKFAEGLHEPLGMFWQNGALTVAQRPELTRIRDTDGDGLADDFETIYSGWGINGDYHEFAWGSSPDRDGNVWIALCLSGSYYANSPMRGLCLRITPGGKMIPTCSGLRSPGGIGFNDAGDAFYTDNQGVWNGSSSLKWLKPGSFQGNPESLKFYDDPAISAALGPKPTFPRSGSRIQTERTRIPQLMPPAVILPHAKVGQSPSGFVCDTTGGKFGPWQGQMLIGEQTHSQVQRACLEKVNGIYQGAVFHMLEGFECGLVPVKQAEDGTLFVGGTNRGWPSRGTKSFTFERVRWSGKTPFEIRTMKSTPEGFELEFTRPAERSTAGNPGSYTMDGWTYIYQSAYGSPEVDAILPKITTAQVSEDGLRVKLTVEGRKQGHVHHLTAAGLRSPSGESLWHPEGWFTLNEIPSK